MVNIKTMFHFQEALKFEHPLNRLIYLLNEFSIASDQKKIIAWQRAFSKGIGLLVEA